MQPFRLTEAVRSVRHSLRFAESIGRCAFHCRRLSSQFVPFSILSFAQETPSTDLVRARPVLLISTHHDGLNVRPERRYPSKDNVFIQFLSRQCQALIVKTLYSK